MPKCPHCGIILSSQEFAASNCAVCGQPVKAGATNPSEPNPFTQAAIPEEAADSSKPAVVNVLLSEADCSFRKNSLDGVSEMVIDDGILPSKCCICTNPASLKREVRFLDPLPASFWYVIVGGPVVVALALIGAVLFPSGDSIHLLTIVATLVGGGAGLWTAQGAFRRGRNIASIYLCDNHVTRDKQLDRRRLIAKILFIMVAVGSLAWLPMTIMAFIADRTGTISFPMHVFLAAVGPVAFVTTMTLLVFFGSKLSRYRGLSFRLRQDKLQLTCRNHEYAKCVATHTRKA